MDPKTGSVLGALAPLAEAAGRAGDAREGQALADLLLRTSNTLRVLTGLHRDMVRGKELFEKAYSMGKKAESSTDVSADDLLNGLLDHARHSATLARVEEEIQELKVHHAALLEGYHEATLQGSKELLRRLDPAEIREEMRGTRIKVGPFALGARFQPVMIQAIWEEFLHRFRRLKDLEPADVDRLYREGFRSGYLRFRHSRLGGTTENATQADMDRPVSGTDGEEVSS